MRSCHVYPGALRCLIDVRAFLAALATSFEMFSFSSVLGSDSA